MNKIDRLYNLANLLSFLAMVVMLMDAIIAWRKGISLNWMEVVFWILFGGMFVLTMFAKRQAPERVNPNMLVPSSRIIYLIGMVAFICGYFFLEKGTIYLVIAYVVAALAELLSGWIAAQTLKKMRTSK